METKELRQRTRVSFSVQVEIARTGGEFRPMRSRDVSLRGLYAYTDEAFDLGEACDVRIKLLKDDDAGTITVKGVVVRSDRDGVGIQFTEINADGFYHLKNILYYSTGDPDKIDQEVVFSSAFKDE